MRRNCQRQEKTWHLCFIQKCIFYFFICVCFSGRDCKIRKPRPCAQKLVSFFCFRFHFQFHFHFHFKKSYWPHGLGFRSKRYGVRDSNCTIYFERSNAIVRWTGWYTAIPNDLNPNLGGLSIPMGTQSLQGMANLWWFIFAHNLWYPRCMHTVLRWGLEGLWQVL